MFISALFTIVMTWKPPRCSLTKKKKMNKEVVVYIYNQLLLSCKKEQNCVSYSDADEPVIQSEVSQKEKKKNEYCIWWLRG